MFYLYPAWRDRILAQRLHRSVDKGSDEFLAWKASSSGTIRLPSRGRRIPIITSDPGSTYHIPSFPNAAVSKSRRGRAPFFHPRKKRRVPFSHSPFSNPFPTNLFPPRGASPFPTPFPTPFSHPSPFPTFPTR